MAVPGKVRQKQYKARERAKKKIMDAKVLEAISTLPPEYADDCKMWIAPPGLNDKRPRINWDIGAETHALIEAHAKFHGVTLDDVLYEVGRQYCMKRPDIYWAMKSAKINISAN